MMASLKSEFRKILTVRSTYVITGLLLLLVIFYAGFGEGFKIDTSNLRNPFLMASVIPTAISIVAIVASFVGVLLVSHEYRYTTIMYTLTASNSRTKSLLAKFLVITAYSVVFTLLVCLIAPLATYVGIHLRGYELISQTYNYGDLAWRSLFYVWGYGMLGAIFAVLFRNIVAASAAIFLLPSTIEPLIGLIIKHNQIYLPTTVLLSVISPLSHDIDYGRAAFIYLAYLAVGSVVAFVLFARRDAN